MNFLPFIIFFCLTKNVSSRWKTKNLHRKHSEFHLKLRKYVHRLEKEERKYHSGTNSDFTFDKMSQMSSPIASQVRSAYAPGFGPESLHFDAPDQDLPATDLTDTSKFPGAGTQYPASQLTAPTFCCTCKKGPKAHASSGTSFDGKSDAYPRTI